MAFTGVPGVCGTSFSRPGDRGRVEDLDSRTTGVQTSQQDVHPQGHSMRSVGEVRLRFTQGYLLPTGR